MISSGGTLVIRPDSGDPVEVLPKMFRILGERFGYTTNAKGYKVLNNVRVIWGDGINNVSLSSILRCTVDLHGWSADNIAFGMGGGLLQQCDRDTLKFAMKCSAIRVNGEWRDVFKDPVTDSGKTSLKGRVSLYKSAAGEYYTAREQEGVKDELENYFENGDVVFTQTFEEVKANSNLK